VIPLFIPDPQCQLQPCICKLNPHNKKRKHVGDVEETLDMPEQAPLAKKPKTKAFTSKWVHKNDDTAEPLPPSKRRKISATNQIIPTIHVTQSREK